MRRPSVILVAGMLLVAGACNREDPTTSTAFGSLPLPEQPDTLLPVLDDSQPPDVPETLPPNALFGGDMCSALTTADFVHVFGSSVRVTESGLLAEDTCLYLLRQGSRVFDVRVELSSIDEFTAPSSRNLPPEVPTLPTIPETPAEGASVATSTAPPTATPTSTPTITATITATITPDTVPNTVAPAGPPTGSVDELNGIGLGSRGLQQGVRYEVYVKVDAGFFSVLAPDRSDAVALAKLAVPHAAQHVP